jgi:hypothetical protein
METENLGFRELRKGGCIVAIRLPLTMRRCKVLSRWGELVVIIKELLCVVIFKNSHECASIIGVSDTATIITLTSQVGQCFKWSLVRVLI